MSFIDNCTDQDIESLQEKNMLLQHLTDTYNAERQVLNLRLLRMGVNLKSEDVRK